jgi:hypothetical protein
MAARVMLVTGAVGSKHKRPEPLGLETRRPATQRTKLSTEYR